MLTVNPNRIQLNNKNAVNFSGGRYADASIIALSNPDTRDMFIKSSEQVLKPSFVDGEESLARLLMDKMSSLYKILNPSPERIQRANEIEQDLRNASKLMELA